jgi:hypothetical protein
VKKRKLNSNSPVPNNNSAKPVVCPVCKQNVGSQRFAYHLQKCMGTGGRKSGQERRKKLNTAASASEVTFPTAAEHKETQKLNRLETDRDYFSKNPIIIKIRVQEKGKTMYTL